MATGCYMLPRHNGELHAGPGDSVTWFKADGNKTGGAFALVEETAGRGEGAPLHRHAADHESFYVIDGSITFFLGGSAGQTGVAGTFVHIPAGEVHGFRVESTQATYLILTTVQHGEFYKAITRLVAEPGDSFESFTDDEMGKAMDKFGLEYIGPLPDEQSTG